jgi:hypothetical protein
MTDMRVIDHLKVDAQTLPHLVQPAHHSRRHHRVSVCYYVEDMVRNIALIEPDPK